MSDPTGAGGVLADALACASMGCHAACAITGVVVQDSRRVEDVLVVDDEWIDDQARAVLQDMPVAAFKVGAVGSADNAQAIAEILADYPDLPVVLDPFLSDAGEQAGFDPDLIAAMRALLLPQTTVLTVSLAQARRMIAVATDDDAAEEFAAAECAKKLLEWGAEYALITGAESTSDLLINRLFGDDGSVQNESIERVDLPFRGAGDTLSAAIAALLAQGIDVGDAVREANEFLAQALAGGFRLGMGDAVPDRLFWASDDVPDPGEDDEH
ncbi:MAG: hydroxymethylpyrimidine/phosphomethylpyrimidine kinase [Pseudomonadota bacterium]